MNMLLVYLFSLAFGQGAAAQTARPIGAIMSIDANARRITIKTDSGPETIVSFDENTRFLQVAPDAKDLRNAASIPLSNLAVADRILARGRAGTSGTFAASSIIVMSRQDIAKKHAIERADWEKRGAGGVITATNSDAKEITVRTAGAKSIVIAFAPGAIFRRYASNSIKFSDARPSRFDFEPGRIPGADAGRNRTDSPDPPCNCFQSKRRGFMKWITRERVKVDRVACPWLIRKFVDPQAEFRFVAADKVMEVAAREGAIPFDVPDVELGHHDGKCSFEAIVAKYRLKDHALRLLAQIVHGADVAKDLYGRPEAAGLKAIATGFGLIGLKNDHEILDRESVVYDALYAYCREVAAAASAKGSR